MNDLIYHCQCGYETPVCTGMMMHLSMYKKGHRYDYAKQTKVTDGISKENQA